MQVWDTSNALLATLYMTQPGDNPASPLHHAHCGPVGLRGPDGAHRVRGGGRLALFFNGVLDDVELIVGARDCNGNGVLDECEITSATDCNGNGVLDVCEPDCNDNGVLDECELGTTCASIRAT